MSRTAAIAMDEAQARQLLRELTETLSRNPGTVLLITNDDDNFTKLLDKAKRTSNLRHLPSPDYTYVGTVGVIAFRDDFETVMKGVIS
jgi:hypothetical protein